MSALATDRSYYVYEHWRPDTGACFYVGKGKRYRAYEFKRRNAHHTLIVAKVAAAGLAVDVRIIARDLLEEEAFGLECERIRLYDTLCNMTEGGEGSSGWVPSPEYRQKMSTLAKGRTFSAETKAKLSAAARGKRKSPEHRENNRKARLGKTLSAEHGANISASLMGRKMPRAGVEKQRLSLLGRKHTSEALANMVVAQRKWRAERTAEIANV